MAPDEGEAKGKDEDEEVTIEEVRELKWGGRWTIAAVVEGHWIVLSATRIGDLTPLLTDSTITAPQQSSAEVTPADEERAQFVAVTLADTEEVWADIFAEQVS